MRDPNLMVLDPELVRDIMVKNFKNFQNNGFAKLIDKEADPILGRNPFMMENEEWRKKRSEITPAFTPNRVNYYSKLNIFTIILILILIEDQGLVSYY